MPLFDNVSSGEETPAGTACPTKLGRARISAAFCGNNVACRSSAIIKSAWKSGVESFADDEGKITMAYQPDDDGMNDQQKERREKAGQKRTRTVEEGPRRSEGEDTQGSNSRKVRLVEATALLFRTSASKFGRLRRWSDLLAVVRCTGIRWIVLTFSWPRIRRQATVVIGVVDNKLMTRAVPKRKCGSSAASTQVTRRKLAFSPTHCAAGPRHLDGTLEFLGGQKA